MAFKKIKQRRAKAVETRLSVTGALFNLLNSPETLNSETKELLLFNLSKHTN